MSCPKLIESPGRVGRRLCVIQEREDSEEYEGMKVGHTRKEKATLQQQCCLAKDRVTFFAVQIQLPTHFLLSWCITWIRYHGVRPRDLPTALTHIPNYVAWALGFSAHRQLLKKLGPLI